MKYRSKFDENYLSKYLYSNDIFASNGVPDFVEVITCLYADLDQYIGSAKLNKYEKLIIKYVMIGYKFSDIEILLNSNHGADHKINKIKYMYKKICIKILNEYKYSYLRWLENYEYVKIKPSQRFKRCILCKKDFPTTTFRKYKKRKDGLYYYCPSCDTYTRTNRTS